MKLQQLKIPSPLKEVFIRDVLQVRLKGMLRRLAIALYCAFIFAASVSAKEKTTYSENLNIHLNLKNMHLWHGFVVTPGVMMASSIEYVSSNKKLVAGLWGGASFNGGYTEFSYYTTYNFTKRFNASLVSHNNYSDNEAYSIFSYDKSESPNFVDVVLQYTLSDKFPLSIYWSTILAGQGSDFDYDDHGELIDSYSNYMELRYTLFSEEKTNLTVFAGGAFSFFTQKNFYGEQANFVNLGLNLSHNLEFLSRNFPVSATAFWNPESKVGALQIDISLF